MKYFLVRVVSGFHVPVKACRSMSEAIAEQSYRRWKFGEQLLIVEGEL